VTAPGIGSWHWTLVVAPAARAIGLLVWFAAALVAAADVLNSILAGQLARTVLGVGVAFALIPAWEWVHERRRRVRLEFTPGVGWSLDRLGAIRPPVVLLDAGPWILLRLSPGGSGRRRSSLMLPVALAEPDDVAWARLRQALDVVRPTTAST
jgi:hypothetical protein